MADHKYNIGDRVEGAWNAEPATIVRVHVTNDGVCYAVIWQGEEHVDDELQAESDLLPLVPPKPSPTRLESLPRKYRRLDWSVIDDVTEGDTLLLAVCPSRGEAYQIFDGWLSVWRFYGTIEAWTLLHAGVSKQTIDLDDLGPIIESEMLDGMALEQELEQKGLL